MARPPLGSGARFAALQSKLAARPGVTNPAALSAYIGRKSLGKNRFQALAAAGRKKHKRKRRHHGGGFGGKQAPPFGGG